MESPKLSEEIKKMEYEPLIPAEKKLIVYNLLIGTVLIVFLVWVSHTFFPVSRMEAQKIQVVPVANAATSPTPAPPAQGK